MMSFILLCINRSLNVLNKGNLHHCWDLKEEQSLMAGWMLLVRKKTTNAYDCDFVKPPPSVMQIECPVCHLVLGDPYQAKCCGTNFCHSCSQLIQGDHTHCPMCREENFEVFPNKELKHSIGQLHVWCTHSKDGCRWSGELRELEHHLNEVGHSGECW